MQFNSFQHCHLLHTTVKNHKATSPYHQSLISFLRPFSAKPGNFWPIFPPCTAGWDPYHQQCLNLWSKKQHLWSFSSSEARGDHIPQPSWVICTHPGGKTQPAGVAHPTARVDGHVPPTQQPQVHMLALLVMQRPHITTRAWARAWSQREEDKRECRVPQTQICCPSLTHIWSIQEKPAKSKDCAKLRIVSPAAQLPRQLSDGLLRRDTAPVTKSCTPSLQPGAQEQKKLHCMAEEHLEQLCNNRT